MQRLHDQCVVMLSQDAFYRGLTPEEHADVSCALSAPCSALPWLLCCVHTQKPGPPSLLRLCCCACDADTCCCWHAAYNFDHPDSFDTEEMVKCLEKLKVCPPTDCRDFNPRVLWHRDRDRDLCKSKWSHMRSAEGPALERGLCCFLLRTHSHRKCLGLNTGRRDAFSHIVFLLGSPSFSIHLRLSAMEAAGTSTEIRGKL